MTRKLLDARILYIKQPFQSYRFLHSSCDHIYAFESDLLLFPVQNILLLLVIIQIILIIIVVVVVRNTAGLHGLPIRKAVVLVVHIKIYRQTDRQDRRYRERVLSQSRLRWGRRRAGTDGGGQRGGVVDWVEAEYSVAGGGGAGGVGVGPHGAGHRRHGLGVLGAGAFCAHRVIQDASLLLSVP